MKTEPRKEEEKNEEGEGRTRGGGLEDDKDDSLAKRRDVKGRRMKLE